MKHSNNFTSDDLRLFLVENNKHKLLEFIKERIFERYISPVENVPLEYKNGFNMMANACLSIEAFMKILNPYINQSDKRIFIVFFKKFELFESFRNKGGEFYSDVRCGIIHNGETNGLWKINRKSNTSILEDYNINANKFISALKETISIELNSYLDSNFESEKWENLLFSIQRILNNHYRYYFSYGSNMNEERLRNRIGNKYNIIGKGILEGFELTFNKISREFKGNGVANIIINPRSKTVGILYEFIGSEGEVSNSLKKLDKAEGSNYERKIFKVKIDRSDNNGNFNSILKEEVYPYIYICNDISCLNSNLKPSEDYLKHLLAGKKHLSTTYLNFLKEFL